MEKETPERSFSEYPPRMASILSDIRSDITYFEGLIFRLPEDDIQALRDKPEVLSKLKSFYSLCFSATAEDLNDVLSKTTGCETKTFSKTFKASGVEFHYNKLGRLAEEATNYIDLVVKMGVLEDISSTITMPDPSDEKELLGIKRNILLDGMTSLAPGVFQFLFPSFYDAENTSCDRISLLEYIGGGLYRIMHEETPPSEIYHRNYLAESFLRFIRCFDLDDFSDELPCLPMLNQDSLVERKNADVVGNHANLQELAKAVFCVNKISFFKQINPRPEKNRLRLVLEEKYVDFHPDKRVLLIPTFEWAKKELANVEEADSLSDSDLAGGRAFESTCVEFKTASLCFYNLLIRIDPIGRQKVYAAIGTSFTKLSGEAKIYTLRLEFDEFF